ncbi:hypothetical protein PSAN_35760 [Pseudomonas antarctica]|uniref:Uncharacterized protein n=1 Tax=Pseudomonas antarctica TaxID=219572 RepID=A0ABQ7A378_9PSED|nr:hypothetical protein PSAN_35760 [Pseudomonas antarctica]
MFRAVGFFRASGLIVASPLVAPVHSCPQAGYRVVLINFKDGKPAGMPVDALSGFLNAEGEAQGRQVGVLLEAEGALRVAQRRP